MHTHRYKVLLFLLLLISSISGISAFEPTTINDIITPEMYGAKGDGKTDDTKAIQKAIDESNGKHVFFAQNNYLISATLFLKANTKLIGQSTKIINKNQTLRTIIEAENSDNILIDGFEIDFPQHNKTR